MRVASKDWRPSYLVTDEDRLWLDEGLRMGWRLRVAAEPRWRLWGIRQARWALHAYRVMCWDRRLEQLDIGPMGYEAWLGHAIWRGWM